MQRCNERKQRRKGSTKEDVATTERKICKCPNNSSELCRQMTPKSTKNRSKIDSLTLQNRVPEKRQKMNDFGTILELVLAPKIVQKSTLFFLCFLYPSKNGVATILTSKTTPKWNPFRQLVENRRPCDVAAIYYTLERFCTSGEVKIPT